MPHHKPDYSTWFTKQQAAEAIGVSTKTIQVLARDKEIQQARWKRPSGGPRLNVYAPEDVQRLAAARHETPAPFVVQPGGDTPVTGRALAHRPVTPDGSMLLGAILDTIRKASEHAAEKVFLTIPEAAEMTGLSQAYIRRGCQDGSLKAIRDSGWKIRRATLLTL
jgi:excisionase family DNA binding protein